MAFDPAIFGAARGSRTHDLRISKTAANVGTGKRSSLPFGRQLEDGVEPACAGGVAV